MTLVKRIGNLFATPKRNEQPLDKVQLEAAQDRLTTRRAELDESVDELRKMLRRIKRKRGKE